MVNDVEETTFEKPVFKTEKINDMELEYTEVKDNRGNVKERRVQRVILQRLKNLNSGNEPSNIEFRATHKPTSFVIQEAEKDESGFKLRKRPQREAVLLKDLDVKFTEIRLALEKNKVITLQLPVTPMITKKISDETNEMIVSKYFIMNRKQIEGIEILKK